jgi:hypothetical protein
VITVKPDLKIEQLVKEIIRHSQKQIILEIPENTALLTNEINLRLLKFYAEDEEKELIINAVDPQLVALAQRLGISTIRERNMDGPDLAEDAVGTQKADTADANELIPVAPVKSHKKRRKTYHWKHNGFLPAVVAALSTLLVGLWLFLQPKVLVTVYPKVQQLNFGAKVTISPEYRDEEILSGKIPAQTVEKTTEFQIETVTTGSKVIGITPATGSVILINHSKQPVVIPRNAIVSGPNGVKFKIGKNVLVPAKITRFRYGIPVGEEYGKVEAPIRALENGARGNQPPKTITKLEGKMQNQIQVINFKPTVNGTDRRVAVVTQADLDKGTAEATRQMRLAAADELESLAGAAYLFFPELVRVKVLRLDSSPSLASEATAVKTTIKYRAEVIAPALASIHKYLASQLESNLPPKFATTDDTVKLVSSQVLTADQRETQLHLVGRANLRGILSPDKVRNLIKGKSISTAKKLLMQQSEVAEFKIEPRDSRRNTLPRFGFQIKLSFPSDSSAKVRM